MCTRDVHGALLLCFRILITAACPCCLLPSPPLRFDIALSKAQAIAARMPHNPAMASLHGKAGALAHCRSRGNDMFNAGNFTGALAEYSQGIRLEARNPTLLSNRAACFAKLGRWQEAVRDCTVAIEANPSFSKALLRRAHCYTQVRGGRCGLGGAGARAPQCPVKGWNRCGGMGTP